MASASCAFILFLLSSPCSGHTGCPVFHIRFSCSRVLCEMYGVLLSGTRIISSLHFLALVQVLFQVFYLVLVVDINRIFQFFFLSFFFFLISCSIELLARNFLKRHQQFFRLLGRILNFYVLYERSVSVVEKMGLNVDRLKSNSSNDSDSWGSF